MFNVGQNRYVDVALVTAAIFALAWQVPQRARQHDFAHYYASSRLLIDGEPVYGRPLAPVLKQCGFQGIIETDISQATNPPPLLWLFAPLALLPPEAGFSVWLVVQVACLAGIFWLTSRLIGDRLSQGGWRMFCAVVMISPAVYWHFHFSQVQLLLALLVLLALTCQQRGQSLAACLLVCTAGMMKLFPFVLLPWFLWRGAGGWRAKLGRIAACFAFVTTGVLLTDTNLWLRFLTDGRQAISAWAMHGQLNYTISSLIYNVAAMFAVATSQLWLTDYAWPVGVTCGLACIIWAYYCCWRGERDDLLEFSLLSIAMLSGGATAWVHYQVMLIFPLAYLLCLVIRKPSHGNLFGFAAAVAMLFLHGNLFLESSLPRNLALLMSYMPLYGLLTLSSIAARIGRVKRGSLRDISRSRRTLPAPTSLG